MSNDLNIFRKYDPKVHRRISQELGQFVLGIDIYIRLKIFRTIQSDNILSRGSLNQERRQGSTHSEALGE